MSPFNKTLLAIAISALPLQAFACASCGCSVNSDWGAQGVSTGQGWSIDLRYDYLNQDQLRAGHGTISADAARATINNQGDPAEVEKFTKNQYTTATLDYNNGASWGLSLQLPYIHRTHSTYGQATIDASGNIVGGYPAMDGGYDSSASGLGDIKLIGRYFGLLPSKNLGLQMGLKLATGKKDQVASSDNTIAVDPGLQLGTGTTDLVLGVYWFDNLDADWDSFAQASYQTALDHSTMAAGSYKPGDGFNLNLGVRYHGIDALIPTLQINSRFVSHDTGPAADTYATGGTLVYLTPGLIVPVGHKTSLYASVQVPVYQNVRGIQLTPKYIFSAGMHASF